MNQHMGERGVRDDFSAGVKETLAKRVAYQCSKLGCGHVTSGPQEDPARSVNLGVAAHITAASPGGARYDPTLTTEQRCSIANGIWLCQTCAKLVDNDERRYPAVLLREWKDHAEARAARALEGRAAVTTAVAAFDRLERLMPALLAEMRQDLGENPCVRECILMGEGVYISDGQSGLFEYKYAKHPELTAQFQILENYGLVRDVTYNEVKRYRISEDLAQYLGVA